MEGEATVVAGLQTVDMTDEVQMQLWKYSERGATGKTPGLQRLGVPAASRDHAFSKDPFPTVSHSYDIMIFVANKTLLTLSNFQNLIRLPRKDKGNSEAS
ncbi:hypothetical protein TWF706_004970 [Orbilia oligospora]|nr:hypothetical protein TWF706_004970 [Orbilia oligospora]